MRTWIAGAGELETVAALIAEFRDWFGNDAPADERILESVRRIHRAGDGVFLLGTRGGEPEGVCQLRFRWSVWTSAPDAWLEDVFVRDAARGTGLGRALVEAAVVEARARGSRRIELDVDEANEPALALYLALGFSGGLKARTRSLLLGLRLD